MFNWRQDSTNYIHLLRTEIAPQAVAGLLVEIRIRHEVARVIPRLAATLSEFEDNLKAREALVEPAFEAVDRLRAEFQVKATLLDQARVAYQAGQTGGVDVLTPEAQKMASRYPVLDQELGAIRQELDAAQKVALAQSEGLSESRIELKNGRNHLDDLQRYLAQPLPDSAWLVDWLRSQFSVATENLTN